MYFLAVPTSYISLGTPPFDVAAPSVLSFVHLKLSTKHLYSLDTFKSLTSLMPTTLLNLRCRSPCAFDLIQSNTNDDDGDDHDDDDL